MAYTDNLATWDTALGNPCNSPRDCAHRVPVRFRIRTMLWVALLLFFASAGVCRAQSHYMVCKDGDGNFDAAFRTGVQVRVGAARNGELATRACQGVLTWDKRTLVVADDVPQLDVDSFGVDLDVGVSAVTFQVKESGSECCVAYRIYSLAKPPKLLRTITGGEFFSAADTDLDGRVEIWTNDAAAVNGFERLVVGELDFAPTMVLRFTRGRLYDVSSEFQAYFDQQIANVRAGLDAQGLLDFKNSDGRLLPVAFSSFEEVRERNHLQGVKIKVLEIVWSYLYSGREQEAWRSLAEMWPPADMDRIQAAIVNARTRGIRSQVDSVSTTVSSDRKTQVTVFNAMVNLNVTTNTNTTLTTRLHSISIPVRPKLEVVPPEPILLRRSPLGAAEQHLADSEVLLILVIDSAGKVRSADPIDDKQQMDRGLKNAISGWKFIPAFRNGRAVASRAGLAVSIRQ